MKLAKASLSDRLRAKLISFGTSTKKKRAKKTNTKKLSKKATQKIQPKQIVQNLKMNRR
jgi:hypothetical protein